MNTTGFITHFLKSNAPERVVRPEAWLTAWWFCAICLCLGLAQVKQAAAAELTQLNLERADDGVYLSAVVRFELPAVVEDALVKGIPMFFVVEADIYQNRWYWTDKRVANATRTIRLAYAPLTRRWRVNIVNGLINSSGGFRATLNQNYDTLTDAMSAVQRLSRWKIADSAEVEPDVVHKLEFSFSLDLSQLPRPFQIGVAGQKDWKISVQHNERLQLSAPRPSAIGDKPKEALPIAKEADK